MSCARRGACPCGRTGACGAPGSLRVLGRPAGVYASWPPSRLSIAGDPLARVGVHDGAGFADRRLRPGEARISEAISPMTPTAIRM